MIDFGKFIDIAKEHGMADFPERLVFGKDGKAFFGNYKGRPIYLSENDLTNPEQRAIIQKRGAIGILSASAS